MPLSADHLSEILRRESAALVKETVRLALEMGFTDQTSSMRAAWTEATERLNDCIVSYLCDPLRQGRLDGRHDYRSDKRFESLREIAWRHHDAGVPLELHHGLFKLYRRVYTEHLAALFRTEIGLSRSGIEDAPALVDRLEDFFDEADQAVLSPWAVSRPGDAALADSVRRLTRERDQYFGVIESLRGPVFIAGEDGKLVNANQAALQTFSACPRSGPSPIAWLSSLIAESSRPWSTGFSAPLAISGARSGSRLMATPVVSIYASATSKTRSTSLTAGRSSCCTT